MTDYPLRLILRVLPLLAAFALTHARADGVTRRDAVETAESYRGFVWVPAQRNVFHGFDKKGVRVDTPDNAFHPPNTRPGWWVPDVPNYGMPYKWGGFDTPETFTQGLSAGKYAGDIYTPAKRQALDHAVSQTAVGIDCSGLVSRCWRLKRSYSTRELPALCTALASYDALQPGDILNTTNQHVLLFQGWKDATHQRLLAYETGAPPTWKVLLDDIPVTLLHSQGYRPNRYKFMRD